MNFKLDNNTLLLVIVGVFIAYYFFSGYKEGFKPQRGLTKQTKGISKTSPVIVVQQLPARVSVPTPVASKPVLVVSEEDSDLAGLL